MHVTKLTAVVLLAVAVSACGASRGGETQGPVAGATAGAAATPVVSGGLIGNRIGLAVEGEARSRAMAAEYQALQHGPADTPVVWRDPDDNVYGEVVPGAPYRRGGSVCRDYTHTIYVDGRPQTGRAIACRLPDGGWQTVS